MAEAADFPQVRYQTKALKPVLGSVASAEPMSMWMADPIFALATKKAQA